MTTLPVKNSLSYVPLRRGFLLPIVLTCFALLPTAQAVSPPPDGGYANENTAEGINALFSLTTGTGNTAIGFSALQDDTSGTDNTATGYNTLYLNNGTYNTATGVDALYSNTTGGLNTANGTSALYNNTMGGSNTATGVNALYTNKTGSYNTATGVLALKENTTGTGNTATGLQALYSNNGGDNTANGLNALYHNTTGGGNTATGEGALGDNTTGGSNIALGFNAGATLTTGSNNIDIDNVGVAAEGNTIRIGTVGTQTATFVAGIHGVTVASAVGVVVDVNGHLGTVTSSARFKDEIKPMDKASEAILALKPVTFRYKHELDPEGIPQFGLVAEEVEKVNPDLVVRDADGRINTVRYEAVNAMLLNEFLKEYRKVQEQDRKMEEQGATIAKQQKQIDALTTGLQKVSAQVEANKFATQMVANDQ